MSGFEDASRAGANPYSTNSQRLQSRRCVAVLGDKTTAGATQRRGCRNDQLVRIQSLDRHIYTGDDVRIMADNKLLSAMERWVDDHGGCLYRYVLVRVREPEGAEDLVQETFLAAVRGYEKFGGRSSERSWLVGILKNKIVDYYRKLGREISFAGGTA